MVRNDTHRFDLLEIAPVVHVLHRAHQLLEVAERMRLRERARLDDAREELAAASADVIPSD